MRPEKQYLVQEVNQHLDKSDYVYLANYERITVEEIAELRASLSEHNAEFHVVKNSIFGVAAAAKDLPDLSEHLTGQTAIIVGGDNPSGVAKTIGAFFKKKEKVDVKAGVEGFFMRPCKKVPRGQKRAAKMEWNKLKNDPFKIRVWR